MNAIAKPRHVDALLDPLSDCLTPAVAERIVNLRADTRTQRRLDELAEKNAAGALTPRESAEYDAYIETLDMIAILQATARKVLKSPRRTR